MYIVSGNAKQCYTLENSLTVYILQLKKKITNELFDILCILLSLESWCIFHTDQHTRFRQATLHAPNGHMQLGAALAHAIF